MSDSPNPVPQATSDAVAPSVMASHANADPTSLASKQTTAISLGKKELGSLKATEMPPVSELGGTAGVEKEPLPPEVSSWMQKVEQENAELNLETLPPIQVPNVAASNQVPQKDMFILPLGSQDFAIGLHANVNQSLRWLVTWAKRLMKQLKGQTAFQDQKV